VGEGAGGWGDSVFCHRERCKNRQGTLNRIVFGQEDLVKTKLFTKDCEKSKRKSFILLLKILKYLN
jgi:hypothetical protein